MFPRRTTPMTAAPSVGASCLVGCATMVVSLLLTLVTLAACVWVVLTVAKAVLG